LASRELVDIRPTVWVIFDVELLEVALQVVRFNKILDLLVVDFQEAHLEFVLGYPAALMGELKKKTD
jgi:hypothetical protein